MSAEFKSLHPVEFGSSRVPEAYAYCRQLAREHYENFPVGSLLVPKSRRKHVYSIYAFARQADDFADEGYESFDLSETDRLAALSDWERQLEDCYCGRADQPIFLALSETVRELELPIGLFRDLLSAFKQDVVKRRYSNFEEVLDYCKRSANPIGRLILLLFGYRDERLFQLSDYICSGLQLANFWQDVDTDMRKDRVYLPQDEMARFDVPIEDLKERRVSRRYAALLAHQVARTKKIFENGKSLPAMVSGRLAIELRLTWLGGMRILEKIEDLEYDTLNSRPKITALDKVGLVAKSLFSLR